MTLRPEQVGDKGQRYVAQYRVVDDPDWRSIGYSDNRDTAWGLARAFGRYPSAVAVAVLDRTDGAREEAAL
jgi:hypothetical protein